MGRSPIKKVPPPCAGSCPDPPPDSRPTLPFTASRSERSTTLWPLSRQRPPEALTRPQRASSTQWSGELISFFWGWDSRTEQISCYSTRWHHWLSTKCNWGCSENNLHEFFFCKTQTFNGEVKPFIRCAQPARSIKTMRIRGFAGVVEVPYH